MKKSGLKQSIDAKLLNLLVTSVKDYAIFMLDPQGNIISWNKGAEQIKGYKEKEIIGKHMSVFYTEADNAKNEPKHNLSQALKKGSYETEGLRLRKDGTTFWADVVFTSVYDEDKKLLGFAKVTRDGTGRKKAEDKKEEINLELERRVKENTEKIISNELRYRKLIENSHDGITLLDKDLNVIYRSSSAERINGWTDVERNEIPVNNLIHPDDKALVNILFAEVLAKPGQPILSSYRARHKQGHYIWLECLFTNMLDDPDINAVVCNFRDISGKKNAEEEVGKKNVQIEGILESITDGFLAMDGNMRYTYGNKRLEGIFGVPISSILGKTILEIFPGAIETETYKSIKKALKEKIPVTNEDYYAPLNLWTENRIFPARDGVSMFIRDITARKNDELRKALLSEISIIFNEKVELNEMLRKVLELLVDFGNFSIAEAWLIGVDKNKIRLAALFPKTAEMRTFYEESNHMKSFVIGEGLPGIVWETQTIQFWPDADENEHFLRRAAAKKAGLKTLHGIPVKHNNEIVGVLLLGLDRDEKQKAGFNNLIESVSDYLGAEIKRKQLEQELYQVFNFAPDIICIAGVDGYFKKVNPSMSRLLEYTEEELLARPYVELVHPDDRGSTITEVTHVFGGSPSLHFENRYVTKSGKIRSLAWTATEASDESLLFCVARDITDKKELQDLLNKATTLAHIGGWEVDLEKRAIYWSDMTREIHELGAGIEISIEDGTNFYKEGENRDAIVKVMEDAVINGTPGDVELQIVTAKGNIKWVRVIIESEFLDGKCSRLYGSFQDIDVRKRAEIASTEALEERNTILESIDDAFFAVDKNWVVTYWNNKAAQVLMTDREKILNQNLWDVFSDSVNSESYKKYNQAVKTNQSVHFEDYFEPLKRWYEISAYPSGTGLSVYFKDVSDRKLSETLLRELNANLQKQTKELAISNAELEQFAYVASHDLQEPLRMVTSFLTQLEKKYGAVVDDKGRQYIHFAVDGAKRMRQIILDLLDFSRVGRGEEDLEEVDFNKLLNEILALYRRQIDELDATISFENLPSIHTYKTPLRQVFQNLIGNSLKYHNEDRAPIITITCKDAKTHYQFAIMDNGIGIAPEFFDKIFIIFQRLHNKEQYSGTGMGLAITKKIVENLGGKIWVKSEEGKGSTFYFTLTKSQ